MHRFMSSEREDLIARLMQAVERHRAHYVRMKQAANNVTVGEVAEAFEAYQAALETLTGAVHRFEPRQFGVPAKLSRVRR